MPSYMARFRRPSWPAPVARIGFSARLCAVALLAAGIVLPALYLTAQQSAHLSQPAPANQSAPAAAAKPAVPTPPAKAPEPPAITEDQLRQLLVGKDLFLRGGYLDNTLEFNEDGVLTGHSPQGSYTLCAVRINRVRLFKRKVEFDGERYGLHFLGALPGEDPGAAVDRVNITPTKKPIRITIDRELVVKEKPQKKPRSQKAGKKAAPPAAKSAAPAASPSQTAQNPTPAQPAANPAAGPEPPAANSDEAAANPAPQPAANSTPSSAPPAESPTAPPAPAASETASQTEPGTSTASSAPAAAKGPSDTASDAAQAQAEIAQAPAAERPADTKSVTTTHSQTHANHLLEKAIDNVFAEGLDARMMAAMPGYWKLYYQPATESGSSAQDPAVLSQSMVDKKARLISAIDPASNQFAQDYGVAGMAEYQVVIGVDGKPKEIAIARPIGFGLDESAIESLRKAAFEPAIKDGQPVPVALDVIVEFRIYSNRTAEAAQPQPAQTPNKPVLPGPYSVQH
ncbi:MAG: energy transducer TonB [Terracidiphilus sp.]